MLESFWSFLVVSAVVIVVPGPDTALTIRNSIAGGRIGGVTTALGVSAGQMIWAVATAAGVTTILLASERIFHLIKLFGLVYLIVLGAQALVAAIRSRHPRDAIIGARDGHFLSPAAGFRQGLVSNLGNPKMAVFFASVFPQFAPPDHAAFGTLLTLGIAFATMTIAWLCVYAFAIPRAARLFGSPRFRRVLEALSGVALIGLGARMALERE